MQGNLIGLSADGSTGLGNGVGVYLFNAAFNVTIGGPDALDRNVISGNVGDGLKTEFSVGHFQPSDETIQGNYIGTNRSGTAGVANAGYGVDIVGSKAITVAGNVISSNAGDGVYITGSTATANVVQGNYIGLDATGTIALPNAGSGVNVDSAANTISGNVVSANAGNGVQLVGSTATGNVVEGNYIGTDFRGNGSVAGNVTWYKGEGNANDAAGANNGSIVGGVTFTPGKVGQAFTFDGINSGINVPDGPSLAFGTGDFTLETWVNTSHDYGSVAGSGDIVRNYSGLSVYSLEITGSDAGVTNRASIYARDSLGHTLWVKGTTAINDGQWHHVAGVRRGTVVEIYVDGVLENSLSDVNLGTIDNTAANITIGVAQSNLDHFFGSIDELGIYNRALKPAEIAAIVGYGSAGRANNNLGNAGVGVNVTGGATGNTIGAAGAGNVISGNNSGVGIDSASNVLAGNLIGTDATGTVAIGNNNGTATSGLGHYGVYTSGANTVIGGTTAGAGNVIADTSVGVWIRYATSAGTVLQGNEIGTNRAGTAALANVMGVILTDGVTNVTIGGNTAAARNLISGNTTGIDLNNVSHITVSGNYIGTNAAGTGTVANTGWGVYDTGANNTIGGTAAGAGNLISGNRGVGVGIYLAGTTGNQVVGNLIGTDKTGTVALANGGTGVDVSSGANGNVIGGSFTSARNVISGNTGAGVHVAGPGISNQIIGDNYIGLATDGTTALPNAIGVQIDGAATGTVVGNATAAGVVNWLVADYAANTVRQFAGSAGVGLGKPLGQTVTQAWGMAYGPDGNLYVASLTAGVLRYNGKTGAFIDTFIPLNTGGLTEPRTLLFTPAGDLLVGNATTTNGGVYKFNGTTGAFVSILANGSLGMVIGPDGYLYTTHYYGFVYKTDLQTGAQVWAIDGFSQGFGAVYEGLAFGPDGLLYVAANASNKVLRIDPATQAVSVFLSGSNINRPNDVKFGPDGMVYVANQGDGSIARYTVAGVFVDYYVAPGGLTDPISLVAAQGGGNVISGNTGDGVRITDIGTTGNQVVGNLIGTDKTGTAPLANARGVEIGNGASGNTIGSPAAGNTIAFNAGAGVVVTGATSTGNAIRGNSIYSNLSIGIDLGGSGAPMLNSGNHTGPNNFQNFPVLTASLAGLQTRLVGTLTGLPANSTILIDAYADVAADRSHYGQGQRYLGFNSVTTNVNGTANFDFLVTGPSNPAEFVSVTATDAAGNTSEFAFTVADNVNPQVTLSGAPSTTAEGTPVTLFSSTAAPNLGQVYTYQWVVTKTVGAGAPQTFVTGVKPTIVFTPDQAASYVAMLTVADNYGGTGSAGTAAILATVVNPVVAITGTPARALTGAAVSLKSSVTDIGIANTFAYHWTAVLNGVTVASATSADFSFLPTDAGFYTVKLTVTANDGGIGQAGTDFLVAGGKPVATISGAPTFSPEGIPITLSNLVFDPALAGQLTYAWTVTKNNAPVPGTTPANGPTFAYTPDDEGVYQVSLVITDSKGNAGVAIPVTTTATSNKPTAVIGGLPTTPTVTAGKPLRLTGAAKNPGSADQETLSWSVLSTTGQAIPGGSGSTFSFTPAGTGQFVVTLTTTSEDGLVGSTSAVVAALQLPADVRISAPATSLEGSAVTASAAVQNAPAGTTYSYAWTVTGLDSPFTQTGAGATFAFTPVVTGAYRVSVAAAGSDGSSGTATQVVTITNVAPSVTITNAPPDNLIHEGGAIALGSTVSDPGGAGDTFKYLWSVATPDGSVIPTGKNPEFAFASGESGTYVVSLKVTDADNASYTATSSVVIGATVPQPVIESAANTDGVTFNLTAFVPGPAWDLPVASDYMWTVTRDSQPFIAATTGTNFTFARNGVADPHDYVVKVRVSEDDDGTGSAIAHIVVVQPGVNRVLTNADVGPATELMVFALGTDTLDARQLPANVTAVLVALGGHDTLLGGAGTNVLQGDSGFNLLIGGTGTNTMFGVGNDTLTGGVGTNQFMAMPQTTGPLTVSSGTGLNTLSFAQVTTGVTLNFNQNLGQLQTVSPGVQFALNGVFQNVYGSPTGNNSIVAANGMNLFGGSGQDTLSASGGLNITLTAGNGNSLLMASGGTSISLFGGSGNDTLSASGGANITLTGGSGPNLLTASGGTSITMFGGSGNDTLSSTNGLNVSLNGGSGNSVLNTAGGTSLTLVGGAGNDRLTTTGGTSISLFGGTGNDTISSTGGQNITLTGGTGNSSLSSSGGTSITMFGGTGNDTLSTTNGVNVSVIGGSGSGSLLQASGGTSITLFGGSGNDTLSSTNGLNITLQAGSGSNLLTSSGGTSITLFGGSGNDTLSSTNGLNITLSGGSGSSALQASGGTSISLFGGSGNDTLSSTGGTNITVVGGSGNSSLSSSGGTSITMFGGSGNDTLSSSGGLNVSVQGGAGNSVVQATGGTSITLFGGTGNDTLSSTNGNNVTMIGGNGNSSLSSSSGTSITMFGGSGNDTLSITNGNNVTVVGGTGNSSLSSSSGTSITLFGGSGNDTLSSTGGQNVTLVGGTGSSVLQASGGTSITMFGGSGNDTLSTTNGNNVTVVGGSGNSVLTTTGGTSITMFGGSGNDTLSTTGGQNVTVIGGSGNSSLSSSGGTSITLFGGSGNDTLSSTGGQNITLIGGGGSSSLSSSGGTSITMFGGSGDDTLSSTNGNNVTVIGGSGNSSLSSNGGTSISLFGGSGNDTLSSTGGQNVTLVGGQGRDSLASSGGTSITMFGGTGNDTLSTTDGLNVSVLGGSGNAVLSNNGGTSITLFGGSGNDTLSSTGGSNITLIGGSGNSSLLSSGGTSITLFGGSGNDTLVATNGNNVTVINGSGRDSLVAAGGTNITLFGGSLSDVLAAIGGTGLTFFGGDGDKVYQITGSTANPVSVALNDLYTIGNNQTQIDNQSPGTNTIEFPNVTAGVTLDLSQTSLYGGPAVFQPVADGIRISLTGLFQNVLGTSGASRITGNSSTNVLQGLGNGDTLIAGTGAATLIAGPGNTTLVGGSGGDTYYLQGKNLGNVLIAPASDTANDTLDFSNLGDKVNLDLRSTAAQTVAKDPLYLTILNGPDPDPHPKLPGIVGHALGIANVIASGNGDFIQGNNRGNHFTVGAGDNTIIGGGGNDTFFFTGTQLGTNVLTETSGASTLNFLGLGASVNLDLSQSGAQQVSPGANLTLTLGGNPSAFANVVGTPYSDVIKGNGANQNVLLGAGGNDSITAGSGNDILQGGVTQVVLLDFDSAIGFGGHAYTPDERAQVVARLQAIYAAFDYTFAQSLATAQSLSLASGGRFDTVTFNAGPAGGKSDNLDFRRLDFGGHATVNVMPLLGGTGQPTSTSADIVALSAEIAAHELGHLAGLRHADSFGPISATLGGIYSGVDPTRYHGSSPTLVIGAAETPLHVMASPDSVGTTLFDSVGNTYFGEREAIKLAFAETGTVVNETAAPNHSFGTAQTLGALPGLAVPNTLQIGNLNYNNGNPFAVSAIDVVGAIGIDPATSKSADDYYSFTAKAGDLMSFEAMSASLSRTRQHIDAVLSIYDANGNLLATNDDELETTDSVIYDFKIATDDTYFVRVDTYTPDGVNDSNIGTYELFMYSVPTTPGSGGATLVAGSIGGGDTLVGGGGNDLLVGNSGNDLFKFLPGSTGSATIQAGSGSDTVDESGAPGEKVQAPPGINIKSGERYAPTFPQGSPTFPIDEGSILNFTAVASDLDMGDHVTYSLSSAPQGTAINPFTGEFTWTPLQAGPYTFQVVATDASGNTGSEMVSVTVKDVPDVTTTLVSSSLQSTVYGQAVTFTATVTAAQPGGGTPTGTVQFLDGSTVLDTKTLDAAGHATSTAITSLTAGNHSLTVSFQANSDFLASKSAATTLTVSQAALTVTAVAQTKVYGAALPTLTANFSGFVNGEGVGSLATAPTLTTTATMASHMGAYAITVSGAVDGNYAITYVGGSLTVTPAALTITADNQSKVYGAGLPALTAHFFGLVNGDAAANLATQPTLTPAATAVSHVGTYAITASGAVDGDYTISYVTGTLTISQAMLTITADGKSKVYGAALPALTATYSGFVNGDTAANLTTQPTLMTVGSASSHVGTYTITASGAVDGDYAISYVTGTLTVSQAALTITADNKTKVYGAGLPALTVSFAGLVNGDTSASLATRPTLTTAASASSHVGGYAITASGAVDSDYSISYVGGTLTVGQASLTITADNKTKVYGAALPALTASYSGFVNGDTAAAVTGSASLTTTATPGSGIGSYTSTASQGSLRAPDYTFGFASGTLTVTPAVLTVTANNATKVYGTANPALASTTAGFVNGDTSTVVSGSASLNTTATAGAGVGTYAITAAKGSLSAVNYTFAFASGTLTVTAATLTVTAGNATKVYGAGVPTFTSTTTGFVNGDNSTVVSGSATLTTTATAGSGVGSYNITAAKGTLTAANYLFAFASGTLTVTPAVLTVTANNASRFYGATNPTFTSTTTGFVSGDTQAVVSGTASLTTTATATSPAGTYPITAAVGTLTAANYTFTFVAGTLTVTGNPTPTQLAFKTMPVSNIAGFSITGPNGVQVSIENSSGAVVAGNNSPVTIAITSPTGGTFIGGSVLLVNAVNGVATFSNLAIGLSGTYTLTVSDGNLKAATATVYVQPNTGILLLDPTGQSLKVSSNAAINVTNYGAIVINSSNAAAGLASGNANITATEIDVHGGLSTSGSAAFHGVRNTSAAVLADPLAGLAAPTQPTTQFTAVNYSGTLQPGTYIGGINVSGNSAVTLAPGLYYLKGGGLTVSGNATVTGAGVMLYLTGLTGSNPTSVNISSNANVTLTPPTSSPYTGCPLGIVLFQDRTSTASILVSGNAALNTTGTEYAPGATVTLSGNEIDGNPAHTSLGSEWIVADLVLTGNAQFSITADANNRLQNPNAFRVAGGKVDHGGSVPALTQADANAALDAALALWAAAGLDAGTIQALGRTRSVIVPLADGYLGLAAPGLIYLDPTAEGYGWFTSTASAAFPAAGKVDLLTVVAHELGHEFGLMDGNGTALLAPTLAAGVRILPSATDLLAPHTTLAAPRPNAGHVTATALGHAHSVGQPVDHQPTVFDGPDLNLWIAANATGRHNDPAPVTEWTATNGTAAADAPPSAVALRNQNAVFAGGTQGESEATVFDQDLVFKEVGDQRSAFVDALNAARGRLPRRAR